MESTWLLGEADATELLGEETGVVDPGSVDAQAPALSATRLRPMSEHDHLRITSSWMLERRTAPQQRSRHVS
jgi:hypothetical protein